MVGARHWSPRELIRRGGFTDRHVGIGRVHSGRRRFGAVALAGTAAILAALLPTPLSPAGAFPNAADESAHVTFTLEACRLVAGTTLPIGGKFICPDAMYTTGNLGKAWNELDLVPHRLTTSLGSQDAATTDYKVSVAADGVTGGKLGYDVISAPEVNAAKSDASCTVSSVATTTQGTAQAPFGGGTDTVIYKDVTVHQAKGTTCVFDWYQRLALGAHLYPGSSLQSYMFPGADLSGSKKTISIPVNEIAPQALSKDMTATQGSDHVWSVVKNPTPASVTFTDTCAAGTSLSAAVQVTVTWTRLAATPSGPITVVTHVYATNPAARVITTNVTDVIRSGTTALDTVGPVSVDVPPNTTQLVLTHQTTVPAATTNLNDVATATYTDKDTGIPIPGQTQATASATVQLGGSELNQTATITDVESISGAGFSYSTDSFSGAGGSFDGGYVAGTPTTGNIGWTSDTQTGSGSVTFNKTIYVAKGTSSSGTLSDTATVTGSDGFTTSANGSVSLSAGATVSLTIDKTISTVLNAGDASQTFTFVVTGPGGYSASPTITFNVGDGGSLNPKSTTLTGLAPGTYAVAEQDLAPWAHQAPVNKTITLPSCSGSVAIDNTFGPASAQVRKLTVPAGSEAGWTFDLKKGAATVATVTTGGSAYVDFGVALDEGSYTVVEHPQAGWDQTATSGDCSFTVSYPADADRVFQCTYTNTQRGSITVKKLTDPSSSTQKFVFSGDVGGTLGNGETATQGVAPGTYHSTETLLAGWDLTSISCDDSNSTGVTATGVATFLVAPGENVTCTFTNRERGRARVVKTVSGLPPSGSQSFVFQLRSGASPASAGTILETATADAGNGGVINFTTSLVPGTTYQLCEVVMPGWTTTLGPPFYTVFNPSGDNSTVCTDFTVQPGETKTFTIDNRPPPGGLARTIGFWKNWASCASSKGKQAPILDQTLAAADPAGITIGVLTLHAGDCRKAVAILNKTTTDTGKKVASDPGFNLAAQLLAAKLNVVAGAGVCPAAVNAINSAQSLLAGKGWDGTASSVGKLKGADATLANNLASTLDSYNNNTLC